MEKQSQILNALLVVCSISVPTSLVMVAYFYYQNAEIMGLKNELLSKSELQAELLNTQPTDHAQIPHIDREIGYVLNPNMARSTWRAAEGKSYPINALGLRGREIKPKEEGVTRILLVGDSMVFGYKLREQDKLSSILNDYTSQRVGSDKRVEFITIALPGWNIRSESAFLERHIRLLNPDTIVWWASANDIEDVGGVIPPGMYALWASPQAEHQSPSGRISGAHKLGSRILPALAKRHQDNWELISRFHAKYRIPIIMMGSNSFSINNSFNPEWIHRSPKVYRNQKGWNVSPTDAHPSAYANHIIAMGILRKLLQMGSIPEMEFAPEDKPILQNIENEEALMSVERSAGPSQLDDRYMKRLLKQTPLQFDVTKESSGRVFLYGVGQDGEMAKSGTLLLRAPENSSQALLSIVLPPEMEKYPGSAKFSVRNINFDESQTIVEMNSENIEVVLPVPRSKQEVPLYEISWLFDYSHCRGPSECYSGTLVRAGFIQNDSD